MRAFYHTGAEQPMFGNISIILVGTTHPGNIGAAARAMKTMGLARLILVQPEAPFPSGTATALAAGADDILQNAQVVDSLDTALHDAQLIIGTSARSRQIPTTVITPREAAEKIITTKTAINVAIIFGREASGLTNDELARCHFHLHIPTNPAFSSLNLGAAVQIISYELRIALLNKAPTPPAPADDIPATDAEIQLFYQHLEQTLTEINFLKANSPRKLMPRLKRLFNRIVLEKMEFDLLMGILKLIRKKAD
jgi:tRNA (cytidine32/uridine32-2'-O)-methyltransferase